MGVLGCADTVGLGDVEGSTKILGCDDTVGAELMVGLDDIEGSAEILGCTDVLGLDDIEGSAEIEGSVEIEGSAEIVGCTDTLGAIDGGLLLVGAALTDGRSLGIELGGRLSNWAVGNGVAASIALRLKTNDVPGLEDCLETSRLYSTLATPTKLCFVSNCETQASSSQPPE